ncbi:unnamed protein product [Auanema sp. JU1783]|nr:unnamed protein product [Auanema sp. JU1783]
MKYIFVFLIVSIDISYSSLFPTSEVGLVVRAKRQCGGDGGCCAGMCNCGNYGQCGQVCCPSPPPPCSCGTPGCQACVTNTVLVPVQQTTCCQCCRPVCTQACINGGGCGCGCTRGGCGRKRRSLLEIASSEMSKNGDNMV